jgi:NAD(P)-dependent dehydrogenase (short-subunit alcohol dehydrogenase family)
MVEKQKGLIVNVSSGGGLSYLFNVPYGVGKAACDRMAADCAHELKKFNVAMVSLWPGPVKTEYIRENVIDAKSKLPALSEKKILEPISLQHRRCNLRCRQSVFQRRNNVCNWKTHGTICCALILQRWCCN